MAGQDVSEQTGARVSGHAAAGYESLLTVFAENWDLLGEAGAAAALYVDGQEVFHAWGGLADRAAGRSWAEDTAAVVFSSTKGVTAICVHLAQSGALDLDAPVAARWPEFGAAGKEALTVRWVLSHRAGLFAIEEPLTLPEVLAARPVAEALARQRPAWEPGTAYLYHPMSYGYILGELVRRVTGMTLGTYLRQEVAGQVDADVWIGLPPEQEHRVARLVPPVDPDHEGVQPVIAAMSAHGTAAAQAFLGTVFRAGFLGEGTDFELSRGARERDPRRWRHRDRARARQALRRHRRRGGRRSPAVPRHRRGRPAGAVGGHTARRRRR